MIFLSIWKDFTGHSEEEFFFKGSILADFFVNFKTSL